MSDTSVAVSVSTPPSTPGAAPPAEAPVTDSGRFNRAMLYGAIVASVLILAGYVAAMILLFFFEVPERSQNFASAMFNTMQTLATLAAGYWLGSSSSSAQRAANQPAAPKPPT